MAVVAAAVANKGTLWKPRFVKKVERPGAVEEPASEASGRIELRPEVWDKIQEAMVGVVRNGTGQRVNIPGLVVGGKTGTSQNNLGDDHAWFIAYAGRPDEVPSVALAVLIQHGGHGSSAAGPVARKAIEAAFDLASAKGHELPAEGSMVDEVAPEPEVEHPPGKPPKPAPAPPPPPAQVPVPAAPARRLAPARPAHSTPTVPAPPPGDGDVYSEDE
jgi:membrane peptidoglycan carboxypeptidase